MKDKFTEMFDLAIETSTAKRLEVTHEEYKTVMAFAGQVLESEIVELSISKSKRAKRQAKKMYEKLKRQL